MGRPRLAGVNAANYRVRRATLDDLPQLIELWKIENLPVELLEKRLTEFQVVDDGLGKVLGAWGVKMAAQQIKLHSEVVLATDEADALRDKFWERLQNLIHNHGIIRLWTRESSPYWHGAGFHPPSTEQLKKLPPAFVTDASPSLVLELRPEPEAGQVDVEQEFEKFREQERAMSEATLAKGKKLKAVATVLSVLLFVGILGVLLVLLKPKLFNQGRKPASDPAKAKPAVAAVATNIAAATNTAPAETNAPPAPASTNQNQ